VTEDEARRATVLGTVLTRRGLLLTVAGLGLTAYFPVAEGQGWWPFGAASQSPSGPGLYEIAARLSASESATKAAAVEAASAFLDDERSRRQAAEVLMQFVADEGSRAARDSEGRAPRYLSRAVELLGRSGLDGLDLRFTVLSGIEVSHLDAPDGIALFGADLSGSVITTSVVGPSNAGEVTAHRAWVGASTVTGWNLIGSSLVGSVFPGSRLVSCDFWGADLTSCDFSHATFEKCTFRRPNGGEPAWWEPGREPGWPPGGRPADLR
jgi:uncharacterized protein YjbI with pentapeptide repeats